MLDLAVLGEGLEVFVYAKDLRMGDRSDFIPIRDKQLCSDNRKCSC